MNNIDIASNVMLRAFTREVVDITGWKWKKGVVLFPEARCPYCRKAVTSKAIWVVGTNTLEGQFVPVKGVKPELDTPHHPHVTGVRDICFGNATDALQALFGGLNPESAVYDVAEWLKGKYWRHSCDEMDTYVEDEDEDRVSCYGCEERIENYWTYGEENYCRVCFNEVAFDCNGCGETYGLDESVEGGSFKYCQECWDERYFECVVCDVVFMLQYQGGDGKCSDCYEPPPVCKECNDVLSFSEEQKGTGWCVACAPVCSICEDELDPDYIESGICLVCKAEKDGENGVEEEPGGDVPDTGETV